ncbi:poly(A)-binding protein binding protein [Glugoides intestinalis]
MVCDICLKIKDLGDIYGSFIKSTAKSVYISNALVTKASSISISLLKIEKKYIITASRMALPSFEIFTDEQLYQIQGLKNSAYTASIQKTLDARKKTEVLAKPVKNNPKQVQAKQVQVPKQEKKEWNQFEANEKLFGVKAEFNVDEYAYIIDRKVPGYNSAEAHAEKIAKEIILQEENVIKPHSKLGEESCNEEDLLYSTVIKTDKWDAAEALKEVKEKEKPKVEIQKKVEAEIKPSADSLEKEDINQTYEDFHQKGWNAVIMHLNKKKTQNIEVNTTEASKPAVDEKKTGLTNKESEHRQKSVEGSNLEGSNRNSKNKDHGHLHSKKISDPHRTSNESKSQRQGGVDVLPKFATTTQLVDFIIKNNRSLRSRDIKFDRASNQGIATLDEHLWPLEDFSFPDQKVEEIKEHIQALIFKPRHIPS